MTEELYRYIDAHIDAEPEHLYRLERATNLRLLNGRMCSGHLQGRVLKMLTGMIRPKRVLELGTFSGYSALCIAEGLEDDARLITIEVDDELEDFIREAISKSEAGERIELMIGDAMQIVSEMREESFDMIFLDADKKRYPDYLGHCMRLLTPGGYLIADNTLWDGHVVEESYNKDGQTQGICKFNDMVAALPDAEKVILPLRDGLSIIRKLKCSATR